MIYFHALNLTSIGYSYMYVIMQEILISDVALGLDCATGINSTCIFFLKPDIYRDQIFELFDSFCNFSHYRSSVIKQ